MGSGRKSCEACGTAYGHGVWGSLDFARDFGSGLGRPLSASTSTPFG